MKHNFLKTSVLAFGILGMLASCEKNKEEESINGEANREAGECHRKRGGHHGGMVHFWGSMHNRMEKHLPDCANVTESGTEYPMTKTISFGEGCTNDKGHKFSGTITITTTGPMGEMGTERTVVLQDVSFHGRKMSGTRNFKVVGGSADAPVIEFEENLTFDGKRGKKEKTIKGKKTWTAGFGTEDWKDDSFTIEGEETGSRDGNAFTRKITTPVVFEASCGHVPVKGVVESQSSKGERTIDFGDGTCDKQATVTEDGETKTIDMGKHHGKRGHHKGKGKGHCKKDSDSSSKE